MDEAAPPESGAAAEKKRPLLRRVPTSVIVTVVGIALTAWLLPAFTRQWDDRQKARELKANLVAAMSEAAVKPIVIVRRYYDPYTRREFAARDDAKGAWLLASLQLEARLRTYFSEPIVDAWHSYQQSIDAYFDLPATSDGSAKAVGEFRDDVVRLSLDPAHSADLVDEWRGGDYIGAFDAAGDVLLTIEAEIADKVLAAHTRGYSTTTGDLLHDLIP